MKPFAAMLCVWLIGYLLGSFISADLNIGHWYEMTRLMTGLIGVWFGVIVFFAVRGNFS
jgi:hypothetical protein